MVAMMYVVQFQNGYVGRGWSTVDRNYAVRFHTALKAKLIANLLGGKAVPVSPMGTIAETLDSAIHRLQLDGELLR